jgi:O-antigen/teichoic acid export membrane protein
MQVPASARLHLRTAHSVLTSTRVQRWAGLITSFLAGQGIIQVLNAVIGFLLLRWMSIESYAQFSIAFGFQSMLQWLVDLGTVGAIVALVGDRGKEREVVGKYIRSAKYFRNRLFCFAVPVAAVAFWFITSKHHWPWTLKALLFSSIAGTLYFQGLASFYATPLLINQNIGRFYKPQIISSLWRLSLSFILKISSALLAWTSAWVNATGVLIHSLIYRNESKHLIDEPKRSEPSANKEMLHYLAPTIPWIVFTAFQGQISLFLITWFGQTRNIAEVAALGRLGQLFLILAASNSVIIAPYIARVSSLQLRARYLQILAVAIAVSLAFCAIAFLFPEPLLWMLGSKYENLRREIGWAVAGSSVGYVGLVMLTMHNARKWVYWWWSTAHIAIIITTQLICVMVLDVSSTLSVLYFSLITNIAALLVLFAVGLYGFAYGPPKRFNKERVNAVT